jgi:hypothetical protein
MTPLKKSIIPSAIVFILPWVLCSSQSTAMVTEPNSQRVFRPGQLWPDTNGVHINAHGGGILYYNNTYYWFGEHKTEGRRGNNAWVGVHCYSSKDLYTWKTEGVALPVVLDDPAHDIAAGCIIERPKVIYNAKTKKFVMWFHLELRGQGYNAARAGVAISDHPAGPYTYLYSLRPNAGIWPDNVTEQDKQPGPDNLLARDFKAGQMSRDMTLFVDDDGKAYHLYSAEENYTLNISLLTDDYLKPAGKYVRILPRRHLEGPAIFKRNGIYYLIASECTGWNPNPAHSAWVKSIWGPWEELGNPCIGEGKETTYESQSTYVLPVAGKKDAFIFMADRWRPGNAIDGRYVWLPVEFRDEKPILRWRNAWDLSVFDKAQ